ncbi:hypothetical protein EPUL_001279 [Erysiphe pulchra]|uniref:Uncharacterized protein n=1 Tax=Erysiphe pulchra TaxID=225359 RepID=A0A2S4PXW2_9PEZI|nr:hypothetical protein EPUL_001279 [Erysiphe pulchra]
MSNNQNDTRRRRSSVVPTPMNNIFPRATCSPFPGPITIAAAHDQHRRLSTSALGLPAHSPSKASPYPYDDRRGSTTSSSSYSTMEENSFEEDDYGRSIPTTPFGRRMSLGAQAIRSARGGTSPGDGSNFSFPEYFRIRAESSVAQIQSQKQNFSGTQTSTPNSDIRSTQNELPPRSVEFPAPVRTKDKRPDAFQERMLKGDFYMD